MYSNCFLVWKNKDKLKSSFTLTEWTSIQETINTVSESNNYSSEQKENSIKELKNLKKISLNDQEI